MSTIGWQHQHVSRASINHQYEPLILTMTTSTSILVDNITFRWACVFRVQRRKPAVFFRFLSGVWTHLFLDHRELRKDNDREGPYGSLMFEVSYMIFDVACSWYEGGKSKIHMYWFAMFQTKNINFKPSCLSFFGIGHVTSYVLKETTSTIQPPCPGAKCRPTHCGSLPRRFVNNKLNNKRKRFEVPCFWLNMVRQNVVPIDDSVWIVSPYCFAGNHAWPTEISWWFFAYEIDVSPGIRYNYTWLIR